jgi:hypothetical protein
MASEDSDQVVSGLLPVHRLNDLRDLDETFGRLVPAGGDELDSAGELLEVPLLRTQHRMLPEERDDRLKKIHATTHDVAIHCAPDGCHTACSRPHHLRRKTHEDVRGTLRLRRLA